MSPWQKESWDTSGTGSIFWPFHEAGHKTLIWEVPSLYRRKGASLSPNRSEGCQGESECPSLAIFPSLLHLPHFLFCPIEFSLFLSYHYFPVLIKPSIKMLSFNCIFLTKATVSCKTSIKKICMFFCFFLLFLLLICFLLQGL